MNLIVTYFLCTIDLQAHIALMVCTFQVSRKFHIRYPADFCAAACANGQYYARAQARTTTRGAASVPHLHPRSGRCVITLGSPSQKRVRTAAPNEHAAVCAPCSDLCASCTAFALCSPMLVIIWEGRIKDATGSISRHTLCAQWCWSSTSAMRKPLGQLWRLRIWDHNSFRPVLKPSTAIDFWTPNEL